MELLGLVENRLLLSIELSECKNCHKPMLKWTEAVPEYLMSSIRGMEVYKESYGNFGICGNCIKTGGYPKECTCCGKARKFPEEFKYQLTRYAKYPEDETEFFYVCNLCVKEKPQAVMNLLVDADDSEIVKGIK